MRIRALFVCAVLTTLCVVMAGCIIAPIPSPTKRVGPAGTIKELPAFETFAPGKTTRDDVVAQLGTLDTGVKLPNVFWARWRRSGMAWIVAIGGPGAAMGDASRTWTGENYIAEFDDKGVLKSGRVMKDSELAAALGPFVTAGHEWDGKKVAEFEVDHTGKVLGATATLKLTKDTLQISEGKEKEKWKVSPSKIAAVTSTNTSESTNSGNVGFIGVTFLFSEKTGFGNKLQISTTVEHFLEILTYVRECAPHAVIK